MTTREAIRGALRRATGLADPPLLDGGEHADFASTAPFALARERRMAPAAIAVELREALAQDPTLTGITVSSVGPYLNFSLGPSFLAETLKSAIREDYGTLPPRETRIVLEHTSANPNGPLHVGHIRNTLLGDSLGRCLRKAGYRVEVQYYVNDMGRQTAIVVFGLRRPGADPLEGEKSDHHIARVYIAANRLLEAEPDLAADVDRLMQEVERGEPHVMREFRGAVERCLEGFSETLDRLNVHHDRFVWESSFVRNGDTERLLGRIRMLPEFHSDGKEWLDLREAGFEKEYILRRSDGTTVYATRDLAYHTWKGRNFDRVIDVLGADHKLIGAQLIAALQLLGERPPEIVHFEFVSLPEGSMSTRAGKFVSADDLITEVTHQALHEVAVRRPDLPEERQAAIARSVALAAIRFDIIRISPDKATVFDWKEALNFERQSGPYIQYAHARACSILAKAGPFEPAYTIASPHEIALTRHIARFPAVMEEAAATLRPHLIALYARDLADLFNAFYHFDPVLASGDVTRQSRLTLVSATRNTLRAALETLGIDALAEM